jgi:hypothetical protein
MNEACIGRINMEETTTVERALMTPADREAAGKRLRDRVPRDAHAGWRGHADRADPGESA